MFTNKSLWASKLASDKLFISANGITEVKNVNFSPRYGNVFGSRDLLSHFKT